MNPDLRHWPAGGLHLFALDDGGILYHAANQELHALNSVASFTWARIEQGHLQSEVVKDLASQFGVEARLAREWIDEQIGLWQTRGWIVEAAPPLCTSTRPQEGQPRRPPARPVRRPSRALAAGGCSRHYKLLATRFALDLPAAIGNRIAPVFAHLVHEAEGPVDVVLKVRRGFGGYRLLEDGHPERHGIGADSIAPILKMHLRKLTVNRHRYFMQIHAGAVLTNGSCLLLPGEPGSGKTTLTAGLIASGFGYLSDEVALLEHNSLSIRPVPLALSVKPGAVGPLTELYPDLPSLPAYRREDDKYVRYLPPPEASRVPDIAAGYPVRAVVFPRYTPGASTQLREIGRGVALGRLLSLCLTLPDWLSVERVRSLVDWMHQIECWELEIGQLDEAITCIQSQFGCG